MIQKQKSLNECDLLMAITLIEYLKEKGVVFSPDGYPIPKKEWFLRKKPMEILPFYHRNIAKDPSKTAICFNEEDDHLYSRIQNVFLDIDEYRRFLGVMPMDISVSRFMPIEVQKFNLLLNDLFLAVLGVNGVLFAAPIRYGSPETIPHFLRYKDADLWSVGCVGTRKNGKESRSYEKYTRRAFSILIGPPKTILAYGHMHEEERLDWKFLGSEIREYADYNERSRRGDLYHGC